MDDLADLDWNATPASSAVKPPPMGSSAFYPPIRPTPSPHLSGHATPLSNQASGKANKYPLDQKPSSRSSTPGNDSFSNLVSFNSTKSSNNLTLQERQKLLLNEKSKQEAERRRKYEAQYAAQDHKLWESLGATAQATSVDLRKDGSGKDTAHGPQPGDAAEGDDDLFAAFNAEAKVDSSSHFPPPSQNSSAVAATASTDDPLQSTAGDPSHSAHQSAPQAASSISHDVDDDPFGLAQLGSRQIPSSRPDAGADEEDDILGLLGKPVSERPNTVRDRTAHSAALPIESADSAQDASERAVSEIVEMGFPPDEAREALSRTENGTDVQAATGWLLDEAHRKAKVKKGFNESERNRRNERPGRSTDATGHREEPTEVPNATPAWMRSKDRGGADQRRRDDQSPGKGDKDITKIASEVGNNLFRSANSLWASGRKKVQKAVTELQEDAEPSQPKWMRDAHVDTSGQKPDSRHLESRQSSRNNGNEGSHDRTSPYSPKPEKMTDEAMLLETDGQRRHPRSSSSQPINGLRDGTDHSQPAKMSRSEPRGRLSKQQIEEQTMQAYVSPARRKQKPSRTATPDSAMELSSEKGSSMPSTSAVRTKNPLATSNVQASSTTAYPPKSAESVPTRPKAAPRRLPPVTPFALSQSATQRRHGTEAYKRGDYSSAFDFYTRALSMIPSEHPITIVLHCNRSLVNIKVGDPKAAVTDAEKALDVIGPSRGEGETMALDGNDGEKKMDEYFGKALMRKAEALEQMEKWSEAAGAWKAAVETGVGGATSIQGRDRCEKVAGTGKQASDSTMSIRPSTTQALPRRAPPRAQAKPAMKGPSAALSEAVSKLHEADAAHEREEAEKSALADGVNAKIAAWKGEKQDNLRALLCSLDTVLWPEAGWKKVGMHDLVMANKVKVNYMKGIAKVHPDKIPTTATTEQRMISGSVFYTLNQAWVKFKQENGL